MPKGNGAAFLNRDALLGLRPTVREVQLEAGSVYVRGLNGRERAEIERMVTGRKTDAELSHVREWALSRCICNDKGVPVLDDKDAERLLELPTMLLDELFRNVWELSGMRLDDVEALGKVSGSATSAASTSS